LPLPTAGIRNHHSNTSKQVLLLNFEVANLVITIPETGQSFECASDWTIGEAVRNVREEFVFTGGAIKLNRTSFDADQTFAEEIQRMTGEGIETLLFDGDKIISQGRERESIHFCEWRIFQPNKAQSPPAGQSIKLFI
jgi:hypothetical protein